LPYIRGTVEGLRSTHLIPLAQQFHTDLAARAGNQEVPHKWLFRIQYRLRHLEAVHLLAMLSSDLQLHQSLQFQGQRLGSVEVHLAAGQSNGEILSSLVDSE